MWTTILNNNFKDLLETLKTKPIVIYSIVTMFLAGFFINKWVISKDLSVDEIKASSREINMVRDSMYNYKYQAVYYKELYEKNKLETDSLFNEANRIIRENLTKDKND